MQKAAKWLNTRTKGCWPVVGTPHGYASFIAYVFKIPRENKPSLYFVMEVKGEQPNVMITRIKRICLY